MTLLRSVGKFPDVMEFPENDAVYKQQVVASGMWMAHGMLIAVLGLVAKNQALRTIPRAGQVRWARSQVSRLQAVFVLGY